VGVVTGEELLAYSFPRGHPMNADRLREFFSGLQASGLKEAPGYVHVAPCMADEEMLETFHTERHVNFVKKASEAGSGYLDYGDTPAFKGVFEAASYVVGSTAKVLEMVAKGEVDHGFNPMGGLHHARRDASAGFCVFNDVGVAIELALRRWKLSPVLYVDMDAHHGDGVFYSYERSPEVYIADIHEDGRFLYPGTGFEHEVGKGAAEGTKLNLPLKPGSTDVDFEKALQEAMGLAERARPQLVILQAGGDCLEGDPLTHLALTPASHRLATRKLVQLSHERCNGRMIVLGGGGYRPSAVAGAWLNVLQVLMH
jgi:acetoin utilization protein AcuC